MKKSSALKEGLQSINKGGGFRSLIQGSTPTAEAPAPQEMGKEQAPKRRGRQPQPDSERYGRMCAVVNTELQAKLQQIAHTNGLTFKEVLEEAMAKAVAAYESKHGEIVLSPSNKGKDLF